MRTLFKLESGRSASGSDGIDAILLESERYILTEDGSRISLDMAATGYVAPAVHFDNTTPSSVYLEIEEVIFPGTTGVFGSVIWLKTTDSGLPILYVTDPEDTYTNTLILDGEQDPPGVAAIQFANAESTATIIYDTAPVSLLDNAWHSIVIAIKTDLVGAKIAKIYVDRVSVAAEISHSAASFEMTFGGLSLWIGDSGFGESFTGDMSDFRWMPGIDLLTAGDIAEATLNLFVTPDNKPVDPAVATAVFGVGAALYSGDADTWAINQGTAGEAILTGVLTNASTSPSN